MKKSDQSIVKIFFISLVLCLAFGCNDTKNKKDEDDEDPRSGDKISDADSKYFDSKPDINSDGSKVVFISNRTEELKAYKFDRDAVKKNQLQRITESDDDIGQEIETAISPDGAWIAIIALKDGEQKVFIKDFADQIAIVTVADDLDGPKSSVSFSSDSQYLMFSSRDATNYLRQTYVVKVNADGTVGAETKISDEAEASAGDEYGAVWVPVAGGASYRVDAKVRIPGTFKTSIVSHTFTTLAAVSHATLLSDLDLAPDVGMAASETALYFAEKNPTGKNRREEISIQGTTTLATKFQVSTGASAVAVGASKAEPIVSTAIDIVALSTSKDGSVGIWTVIEPLSCGTKLFYDSSLLKFNSSTEKLERLVLKGDALEDVDQPPNFKWKLIEDVCDSTGEEGEKNGIDGNIPFAKISAGATADSYSVVYTSYFMNRDTEIRLLKVEADEAVFYEVSDNLSPYVPK